MPAGAGWVACQRQPEGRHERERRRQTGKFKPRIERIFRHGERRSAVDSASQLGTSFDSVWCGAGVESSPMRNERVPGSAPASGAVGCASRPTCRKCHRPAAAFFSTQPAGARAGAPEGGRAPRDMALPRLRLPHRSPKVGADRRDARSFRRAAPTLHFNLQH